MATYSSNSIESKDQMELLRFRPTFGVGSRDVTGQIHAIGEIFSNSKDEMPYVKNGFIKIVIFINKEEQKYQIAIQDNGRGVPLPSLVNVFTKPHTSGKYNQDSYKFSSGLFGIGAKATLAVTKRFKAISARDFEYGSGKKDKGYGSIYTENLELKDHSQILGNPAPTHGTLVVFEFDDSVMTNMNDFIENGYNKVIETMQRLHLFLNDVKFSMFQVNHFIPEDFWKSDIITSLQIYNKSISTNNNNVCCLYDSDDWSDPFKYLNSIWGITNNLAWESEDIIKIPLAEDKLGYTIRIYLPKRIGGNGTIALVNDVFITRADSYHIQGLNTVLKKFISAYINDSALRNFFMDKYKLPLYVLMDIKYSGAEFVGTTKESFRDAEFLKLFIEELSKSVEDNTEKFVLLANILMEHIQSEYNKMYTKPIEVKAEQKLALTLNNPRAYKDCLEYGPDSELFIVEGTSASGVQSERNVRNQALYAIRGKPRNEVISSTFSRHESIQRLMKDKIWQDLVRIIGIQPGNDDQDLRTLRFGKICIMHDADPDGDHIEAIGVSNFYLLNPNIVAKGYIWISKPPLFLLQKKASSKYKFFMFNESAIIDYHILLYKKVYDIVLKEKKSGKIFKMDDKTFRSFCYVILHIGEIITDVATRMNIPDFILECLLHCLPYLDKNRYNGVDIKSIKAILPFEKIMYDKITHSLIVSNGMNDYTISLNGFLSEIYKVLYPKLKEIAWDSYDILISTKYTKEMKLEPSSFIKVYKLFKLIDDLFDAKRFKGLGTMKPEDLAVTCIVPNTRALFHIENLEDAQVLFDMMGSDSTVRKEMLETQNLMI